MLLSKFCLLHPIWIAFIFSVFFICLPTLFILSRYHQSPACKSHLHSNGNPMLCQRKTVAVCRSLEDAAARLVHDHRERLENQQWHWRGWKSALALAWSWMDPGRLRLFGNATIWGCHLVDAMYRPLLASWHCVVDLIMEVRKVNCCRLGPDFIAIFTLAPWY